MPQPHRPADQAPARFTDSAVEDEPRPAAAPIVPDSPAALWTSVSQHRVRVTVDDLVPDALRDLVAPIVVVKIGN